MIGIKYGTYNLQDPANGVWVHGTDVYSAPESALQADTLAEADGSVVVQQRYKSKTFTIEGILRRDDLPSLEAAMDEFKAAMTVKNQAFDLDYAGGVRRYLSYASNVILTRKNRGTSATFNVSFLCPDGVGWSVDSTALVASTGITTATSNIGVTVSGSYKCEPLTRLTFNTVSGGTDKTVTVSNGSTQRGLAIRRNWVSGDVLEIDSLKKLVYVNNLSVTFTGQFPWWETGAGSVAYLDDFTSRDVTMTSSYTRRWL